MVFVHEDGLLLDHVQQSCAEDGDVVPLPPGVLVPPPGEVGQ
ncbi:hypothetical protein AB0K71_10640 [Streptomyces syringium]